MTRLIEKKCPVCGVVYGLDEELYNARNEGRIKEGWCCTNGHSLNISDRKIDQVRRERDRLQQQLARKDDEIAATLEQAATAWRTATAYKGQVTRLKNRAAAGVCPCCNRSFQNLARHMKTKHPAFKDEPDLKVVEGGKP